ncbi:MAG: DUF423 domain-containing protein [Candidatus Omnitrophica bacterium]|nr:DUF423 domain-containing protein [Candidatus Omnitrophota bacterium]
MNEATRTYLLWASAFGFLAVAAGAFGAHGLKKHITPEYLSVFETGVRYQMYHALALLAVAWLFTQMPSSSTLKLSANFFVLGTIIFSGSLYILVLTSVKKWGAVTPIGGLLLLAGWVCLLLTAISHKR